MSVAPPFPPPEPFPPGFIEAGIAPLVDALNATRWFVTQGSCEGHRNEPAVLHRVPCVDFVTYERIAKAIHMIIRDADNTGRLNYRWSLPPLLLRAGETGDLSFFGLQC
jgi:hypothetical protein